MGPTQALLLAAGCSSRLGRNKQLVTLDGEPLVRRAARIAKAAGVSGVTVVTGFEADLISTALAGLGCQIVHNDQWEMGMGSSLAAGVRALAPCAAVLVILPDQYQVTEQHLRQLMSAAVGGKSIVATSYAGTLGAPSLFKAEHFAELMALPPAAGAKRLYSAHPDAVAIVAESMAAVDLDTPDDLAQLPR